MRRSLATAANVNKPPVLPVLQTLTEDPSHQGPLPRPQAGCQLLVTIQPQPCEKQPGRPTGQGALTWQLLWVCSFSGAESLRPGQPRAHLQTLPFSSQTCTKELWSHSLELPSARSWL